MAELEFEPKLSDSGNSIVYSILLINGDRNGNFLPLLLALSLEPFRICFNSLNQAGPALFCFRRSHMSFPLTGKHFLFLTWMIPNSAFIT